MTEQQIKARIDSYKEECKAAGGEIPVTPQDVDSFFSNDEDANVPAKYRAAYQAARNGDFSQFNDLPLFLRNVLGASEVRQFQQRFNNKEISETDPELKEYVSERAMNAAFRAGIFALKRSNSPEERKVGEICDKLASYSIMQKTMMPPTEEEVQNFTQAVGQDNAPAELQRNVERQRVMAKAFLMSQLGKYEILDKNKPNTELTETIAETLAHGGRTNYILPKGNDTRSVFYALWGQDRGRSAGVYKRAAATHFVTLRKIDKNGKIASRPEEQKVRNPLKVFRKQNGMDLAVGGIGGKGPGITPVTGRGESGHAYMRAETGDETHCGSLLLGIEGCSPGASSNLGAAHGALAIPGKQSAFISGKGAIGNKLGGRQVDLSALSSQELVNILNTFDQRYAQLQRDANTPEGRQKLAEINDMLIGKPMETEKLIEMFNDLGINSPDITNSINKSRNGYLATRIEEEHLSKEEYLQNIRATYTTKEACKMAKARFESAGNDLELSVGAIKELMFTHAARPSNYAWRHPFKNRKENKTIQSLLKKLQTEKHFTALQISDELARGTDSFGLDWGNGLSNDARDVDLVDNDKVNFTAKDSKLAGIVNTLSTKYRNAADLREIEAAERQQMNQDITEIRPEPQREKIPCPDADHAANLNANTSSRVAPSKSNTKDSPYP